MKVSPQIDDSTQSIGELLSSSVRIHRSKIERSSQNFFNQSLPTVSVIGKLFGTRLGLALLACALLTSPILLNHAHANISISWDTTRNWGGIVSGTNKNATMEVGYRNTYPTLYGVIRINGANKRAGWIINRFVNNGNSQGPNQYTKDNYRHADFQNARFKMGGEYSCGGNTCVNFEFIPLSLNNVNGQIKYRFWAKEEGTFFNNDTLYITVIETENIEMEWIWNHSNGVIQAGEYNNPDMDGYNWQYGRIYSQYPISELKVQGVEEPSIGPKVISVKDIDFSAASEHVVSTNLLLGTWSIRNAPGSCQYSHCYQFIYKPIRYQLDRLHRNVTAYLELQRIQNGQIQESNRITMNFLARGHTLPEIAIRVHPDSVAGTEEDVGAVVKFEAVSSLSAPSGGLEIGVEVTETANFLDEEANIPTSVIIAGGQTVGALEVPIVDNNMNESNGMVTVTLLADTSDPITYQLSNLPAYQSITAEVIDDETEPPPEELLPVVSIDQPSQTLSVIEGESVNFSISVNEQPESPFVANISGSDAGTGHFTNIVVVNPDQLNSDGLHVFNDNRRLELKLNTNIAPSVGHGTITIILRPSQYYKVSNNQETLEITVRESTKPTAHQITVSAPSSEINESGTATFNFQSEPALPEETTISFQVYPTNVSIMWGIPRTIRLRDRKNLTLRVGTLINNVEQGSIAIEITTEEGSNLIPSTGAVITVNKVTTPDPNTVTDTNQEPDPEPPEDQPRISVASLIANLLMGRSANSPAATNPILEFLDGTPQVLVIDDAPVVVLPKISVAADTPNVDEGTPVQFKISGSENLRDDVVVEYTLTPEGYFFGDLGNEVQRVRLTEAQNIIQVQIATIDDTLAEQDGTLTLTLLAGRAYDLSDQSSARVVVSDLADRQQRVEDISLASQDILPDMTGAIAAHTLGIASDRIGEAFSSTGVVTNFNYDGNENLTSLIEAGW